VAAAAATMSIAPEKDEDAGAELGSVCSKTDLESVCSKAIEDVDEALDIVRAKTVEMVEAVVGQKCPEDPDASFEFMLGMDQRRKKVSCLQDNKGWRTIFSLHGSVVPHVMSDPLFLLCFFGFVVARLVFYISGAEYDEDADFRGVHLLGTAVTFFLVFYSGHSYSRFQAQYFHAQDAGGALHLFTMYAKAFLPRARALRLVRHINAAHVAGYVGLSEMYTIDNCLRGFNNRFKVLTTDEMAQLEATNFDASCSPAGMSLAVEWVLMGLRDAAAAGELTDLRLQELTAKAMKVKASLNRLFHYRSQPIPYFYVHLAVLLGYVYLPLVAYMLAVAAKSHEEFAYGFIWEFQNGFSVFFKCVVVLGLRETARIMSDPFGSDLYDMPSLTWCVGQLKKCRSILDAKPLPEIDAELEEELLAGGSKR